MRADNPAVKAEARPENHDMVGSELLEAVRCGCVSVQLRNVSVSVNWGPLETLWHFWASYEDAEQPLGSASWFATSAHASQPSAWYHRCLVWQQGSSMRQGEWVPLMPACGAFVSSL